MPGDFREEGSPQILATAVLSGLIKKRFSLSAAALSLLSALPER
jgi:hypothetical protein